LNDIVDSSGLDDEIKTTAKSVFLKLGQAEAKIHDVALEKVHFHEVGALDTIIDVIGSLVCLKLLGVEKIIASKLNLGAGFITFSHGKFPVPAPATAEILREVPVYSTGTNGELVTPTGAAIISTIAGSFGELPEMRTETVGYGAGNKDFEHPNVLRVFLGSSQSISVERDTIAVIETNIDDMNPQLFENVMEKLFSAGALDVFLTNILMKKNRPSQMLSVICELRDEEKMALLLMEETSSIGIRIRYDKRMKLSRKIREIRTELGTVRIKISGIGDRVFNAVPEYDDCKRIASARNMPLKLVMQKIAVFLENEYNK
jgi:uncharacterized protein (TIGR00299 family) protein